MSSPLPSQLVVPLTARLRTALAQIDTHTSPKLLAIWESLTAYDEAQVAEFARRASPHLAAAKTATVHRAAGYYAMIAGVRPPSVTADHVAVEPDLRGPFIQTWSALKHGDSYEGALAAGASRAEAMVSDLISSSSRLTGDAVYEQANVTTNGWQREPEPGACDWCIEMAGNTYTSAEACDFGHDRCQCLGVPAF